MIDISQCQNAKSAKDYLARDEPAIDRSFGGKGFEHLGVDPADMDMLKFNRLIDNRHAERPKEKLTPRDDVDRIVGWYLTFSPVKAVSLAAQFSPQQEAVREALREAGDFVMKNYIEPTAQVRERKGKHGDKDTGNLMWVRVHHTLSRPVGGQPSPQEHLHYFAVNASHDGERFKATKLHKTFWTVPVANRAFNKRLRQNLENIGIRTKGFGSHWTIDGIDRSTVNKFSPRRDQAMENVEKGVWRKVAGLHGREQKQKLTEEDMSKLRESWRQMLTPREWQCLRNLAPRPKWGHHLHPGPERFDFMRYVERVKDAFAPRREVDRDGPER